MALLSPQARREPDDVLKKNVASPLDSLKNDPVKERKLEERLVGGPAVSTQVGFSTSNNSSSDDQASVSSLPLPEDSRGGKDSSRSRPFATNEGSLHSLRATTDAEKRSSNGPILRANKSLEHFFEPKHNLKRSRSEESQQAEVQDRDAEISTNRIPGEIPPVTGTVSASGASSSQVRNSVLQAAISTFGDEEAEEGETLRLMDDEGDDEEDIEGGAPEHDSPEKNGGKAKKARRFFSQEEDEHLMQMHAKYGPDWKLISQNAGSLLAGRLPNALSKRFATLTKKKAAGGIEIGVRVEEDEVQIVDGPQQPQISQFFRSSIGGVGAAISSSNSSTKRARPNSPNPAALVAQHAEEVQRLTLELEKARREKHESDVTLEAKTKDYESTMDDLKFRFTRATSLVQDMLRQADKAEAARVRKAMSEASFLLGRFTVRAAGPGSQLRDGVREVWEDGQLKKELQMRSDQLLEQKADLERQQKQMRTNKKRAGGAQAQMEVDLEERALEEVRAHKLAKVKQEEMQLAEDRARWMVDKQLHIRELRRMRDEDASKYSERPVLNNRYLLRCLLGKGGFSEVWKAFDLVEMRDVAIKIHELDPSWSEERRRNYSKHAKREYRIHLAVKHPRIVQLYDVIEINQSSCFATVLEFCSGTDLDFYLKKNKYLPEKEAKAILMQVLSALLCLGAGGGVENTSSIIHYDIKPANILFDSEGGIKLTDFGLSKIVAGEHDSTVPGVELTSQGAGTYWYLPPECFNFDRTNPPIISNKVDVWSTGVVFFQMLFGSRPFGEGLSQDSMLKSETMLKATKVEFPPKPVVSDAAKDFIRRCLTYSQDLRPTVEKLCEDPYLKAPKKKTLPMASTSTATMTSSTTVQINEPLMSLHA